jgi:hypothetical protein
MLKGAELVRARRAQAYSDAAADARALGLSAEDTRVYLFNADSNAIWDAQQGRPYTRPVPPKKEVELPKYTELGFMTDEQFTALTRQRRQ